MKKQMTIKLNAREQETVDRIPIPSRCNSDKVKIVLRWAEEKINAMKKGKRTKEILEMMSKHNRREIAWKTKK